jgi:two-component system sensor histidine kinase VicK
VKQRPAFARADPQKLTEIFENLLSNALKYSPEGKPIDLIVEARRKMVQLTVRDRGMGIRPRDRKHIFEKFFRAEDARLAGQGGTGLGLAFTRELVRLQSGQIWFESAPGKGTSFFVALPPAVATAPSNKLAAARR